MVNQTWHWLATFSVHFYRNNTNYSLKRLINFESLYIVLYSLAVKKDAALFKIASVKKSFEIKEGG